eukprot:7962982-Pyramimonas_sp.AAC.1
MRRGSGSTSGPGTKIAPCRRRKEEVCPFSCTRLSPLGLATNTSPAARLQMSRPFHEPRSEREEIHPSLVIHRPSNHPDQRSVPDFLEE